MIDMPGSDFTVISSDGVRFRVHKANLATSSNILSDMLEVGQPVGGKGNRETVTLVERAEVLERVLPFVYPKFVPPLEPKLPGDEELLETLFKYEIFRGIEAAALVFHRILTTAARQNLSLTLTALRVGFSFRTQFSPKLYH